MDENQRRHWQTMIDLIQAFLDGKHNDYYCLVGKLEGALDAADIKDKILVGQWYDYWTPLETRRAIEGNRINIAKATDELQSMQEFLIQKVSDDLNHRYD